MNGYGFNEMCPQCTKRTGGKQLPCAYHNGFVDGYDTAKEGYRNERGRRIADLEAELERVNKDRQELEAQCAALREALSSAAYYYEPATTVLASSDAGAAMLKRLQAAEAVCEAYRNQYTTIKCPSVEEAYTAWYTLKAKAE